MSENGATKIAMSLRTWWSMGIHGVSDFHHSIETASTQSGRQGRWCTSLKRCSTVAHPQQFQHQIHLLANFKLGVRCSHIEMGRTRTYHSMDQPFTSRFLQFLQCSFFFSRTSVAPSTGSLNVATFTMGVTSSGGCFNGPS